MLLLVLVKHIIINAYIHLFTKLFMCSESKNAISVPPFPFLLLLSLLHCGELLQINDFIEKEPVVPLGGELTILREI